MIQRSVFIVSLLIALASCQKSNTDTSETSGRSRQAEGEGRFLPIFRGFGGFRPGGFFGGGGYSRPGYFGGYYPGAYRPGGYYQGGYPGGYYGGYPQYQRPGIGNRPYGGGGFGGGAGGFPSVTRPGSDNTNTNNRPAGLPNLSNLTPSQAALLGQALGASLRPLLMNGGAGLGGGGGGAGLGGANPLADIIAQLG